MVRLSQRQIVALLLVVGAAALILFVPALSEGGVQRAVFLLAAVSVGALFYGLMGQGPSVDPAALMRAVRQARDGERPAAPTGLDPAFFPVFDAIGDLGVDLKKAGDHGGASESRLRISEGKSRVSDETIGALVGESDRLGDSVRTQLTAVEEVVRAAHEVATGVAGVGKQVEALASSAEESSSSILEITATNDEVAENVGELAQSVRETVSSIEEMAYSIKEVAKNVEALSL
ncbi:MAG: hypothetical protein EOO75_11100, partial [Myxococcales bacterium]